MLNNAEFLQKIMYKIFEPTQLVDKNKTLLLCQEVT
jgi:hypothetical protein